MTLKPSAWQTFLEEVSAAKESLKSQATSYCETWYRGQVHSSWSLVPSLFRGFQLPITFKKNSAAWNAIWEQEQDLYYEFSARARELHGKLDDWDVLFAMQHYGVPTRLLDWTDTLGIAVYFALSDFAAERGRHIQECPDDPPCIWAINPYELNVRSDWEAEDLFDPKNLGWDANENEYYGYGDLLLEGELGWDAPVAIYPKQRTDRMQAQHGWFTIHGDAFQAMDRVKEWKKIGRQIKLPVEAFGDAYRFLADAGLGLYSLFPDLTNLAAELKHQRDIEVSEFLSPRNRLRSTDS